MIICEIQRCFIIDYRRCTKHAFALGSVGTLKVNFLKLIKSDETKFKQQVNERKNK